MRAILAAFILAIGISASVADIQAPPRPGPVRKLGSGLAKIAYSGAYFLDSLYMKDKYESGTAAFSVGLVDGVAKTGASTALGIAETATFMIPPYEPFDSRYDLPPADLKNNFW
jgi:putative exosortase-associated protein (TIGR04073 family)